jgi:hypothetical protein
LGGDGEGAVERVARAVEVHRADHLAGGHVSDPEVAVLAARGVEALPVGGEDQAHEGGVQLHPLHLRGRAVKGAQQGHREVRGAAVDGGGGLAVGRHAQTERLGRLDADLHAHRRDQPPVGEDGRILTVDDHRPGGGAVAGRGVEVEELRGTRRGRPLLVAADPVRQIDVATGGQQPDRRAEDA